MWNFFHPSKPGGGLKRAIHALPDIFCQSRSPLERLGFQGVVQGIQHQAMLFIPFAGADMQFFDFTWGERLPYPLAQQISKKMMIAVPTSLMIQWNNKQVGLFKIFQSL